MGYFSILWDGSDGFDMRGSTAKGARMFYSGGTVRHGVPVENEGESRFKHRVAENRKYA